MTTRQKLYTSNPLEALQLHTCNMSVESVVEHKALGLIFDRNQTFYSHTEVLVQQITKMFNDLQK